MRSPARRRGGGASRRFRRRTLPSRLTGSARPLTRPRSAASEQQRAQGRRAVRQAAFDLLVRPAGGAHDPAVAAAVAAAGLHGVEQDQRPSLVGLAAGASPRAGRAAAGRSRSGSAPGRRARAPSDRGAGRASGCAGSASPRVGRPSRTTRRPGRPDPSRWRSAISSRARARPCVVVAQRVPARDAQERARSTRRSVCGELRSCHTSRWAGLAVTAAPRGVTATNRSPTGRGAT